MGRSRVEPMGVDDDFVGGNVAEAERLSTSAFRGEKMQL